MNFFESLIPSGDLKPSRLYLWSLLALLIGATFRTC